MAKAKRRRRNPRSMAEITNLVYRIYIGKGKSPQEARNLAEKNAPIYAAAERAKAAYDAGASKEAAIRAALGSRGLKAVKSGELTPAYLAKVRKGENPRGGGRLIRGAQVRILPGGKLHVHLPSSARRNPSRIGTSYFASKSAAIRYYIPYEGSRADAADAVERKLREGQIHIGKPPLAPGQTARLIDDDTRWEVYDPR